MTILNHNFSAPGRRLAAATIVLGSIGFLCGFLLALTVSGLQPLQLRPDIVNASHATGQPGLALAPRITSGTSGTRRSSVRSG